MQEEIHKTNFETASESIVNQKDRLPITAEQILTCFDTLGMRTTRTRQLIAERLATLAASGADFTVENLWHELRAVAPHLGRATVFRAVEVLTNQGLLHCVPFADGSYRYRLCGSSHHHHVTCIYCRRVVEVNVCLPPELFDAITATTNFAIEGHSLELFGRCADCREEQAIN
jgi:Fur family ferric uptake transcriptional regulator